MGGLLRSVEMQVDFLDLVDPMSPWLPNCDRPPRKMGHGKFFKKPIERPAAFPPIKRRYSRYGLSPELTRKALQSFKRPDAIFVGSMMTYWYPGVFEAIKIIRENWEGTPIILGGVYASLCYEHAKIFSNADFVAKGPAPESVQSGLRFLGINKELPDLESSFPAHNLAPYADSAALLTSTGCPLLCPYCGVHALWPRFFRLPIDRVIKEVQGIVEGLKIKDVAIYDDAFLLDEPRALEILERISLVKGSIRIHAASGLSCKGITERIAVAMKKAGFYTIRLGLETADGDSQVKLGGKVTTEDFHLAIEALKKAGYPTNQIGAYVMAGMPGQSLQEVERAVDVILKTGIQPHLSEYSPVPHSPMYEKASEVSNLDLSEPLFHNPTLLSCAGQEYMPNDLVRIKQKIKRAI